MPYADNMSSQLRIQMYSNVISCRELRIPLPSQHTCTVSGHPRPTSSVIQMLFLCRGDGCPLYVYCVFATAHQSKHLKAHLPHTILMAFRWRADSGLIVYAD